MAQYGRVLAPVRAAVAGTLAVIAMSGTALGAPEAASFDRGRRDVPGLSLTFDGGSDAGQSERILEVLAERGVTATFFLTGRFITANPDVVRRIVAAGHEVGNHTWSHPHLTSWDRTHRQQTLPGCDRNVLQDELRRTAAAFEQIAGRPMAPLWRAPFGEVNAELMQWAAAAGWAHVGWTREDRTGGRTLDSLDWVADRSSRNYLTSEQAVGRILSFGGGGSGLNGGVVLMHLSTRATDPLVLRLGPLIDELRDRGCRLLTVSQLRLEAALPAGAPALTAALAPAGR
jgi:peptidoglycan/xylan/chitin deacetylase (PgdA/CDA1 family)